VSGIGSEPPGRPDHASPATPLNILTLRDNTCRIGKETGTAVEPGQVGTSTAPSAKGKLVGTVEPTDAILPGPLIFVHFLFLAEA
jgi:hypothetical protein